MLYVVKYHFQQFKHQNFQFSVCVDLYLPIFTLNNTCPGGGIAARGCVLSHSNLARGRAYHIFFRFTPGTPTGGCTHSKLTGA